MRPIRLDFKGLRSYRSATSIDFADLDLFAIIGDTGAGKSTVIEALSLALYGRKTWTGGSNLEELIADGENTMAIELTFHAEANDWTVTRSRHRNSSAPINKLECRATGEKVDGNRAVNERIEELLGLDHSQFVRAVVLPQGRFDELLQATRTDRNKILRSIFGLDDLRRVRDDATRRRDSWRPVLFEASARRDALPPDPAGMLTAATASADTASSRHGVLAGAIAKVESLNAAVAQTAERHRTLQRAAHDFAPDRSLLGPLEDLAARAAGLVEERDKLNVQQSDAEQRRDAAVATQASLLRGFDDHRQARAAASSLRSVAASLHELDSDAEAATAEIDRLQSEVPTNREPEAITAAVESAAATLVAAQQSAADANAAVEQALAAWQALAEANGAVAEQRAALELAQAAADQARTEAAVAGAAIVSAEKALESAKAQQRQATRANAAAAAAQGLHAGDPCPVCAQLTPADFVAPEAGDIDASNELVSASEAELATARKAATTAETTSSHRSEGLTAARASLDSALVTVGEARAATIARLLDPDAADEAAALASLRRAANAQATELDAANIAAAVAEQSRVAAAAERSTAIAVHSSELTAAQGRLLQIDTRRVAQRSHLRALPSAWGIEADASVADIEALASSIDAMLGDLDQLIAQTAEAETELGAARQRFSELRVDAVENVNAPASEIARQLNDQLTSATTLLMLLGEHSTERTDEIDQLVATLPTPIPTPVLLDQVAYVVPLSQKLLLAIDPVASSVQNELRRLDAKRGAEMQQLSGLLEEVGAGDIASLHSQAGAAQVEAARARTDIATLEQQVASAAALDAMLDIGRPYLANLDLLIQSLRDQHFVDHLVSAREVELLGEATRRLKAISDGRYGFVPDFGVVRIASGEVRSPDTLSGGERFQAALALALALVEIASRGAGKLDAVFVDEGFGSLDGAALDVALDTLGSVAGGGKLVALISHLHPVAEYVDTVFNVTKDDLFGSVITRLDADAREALLDDDIRSGLTR